MHALRLTPQQSALIQRCTGKLVEELDLETCFNRLTVARIRVSDPAGRVENGSLVIELTPEQQEWIQKTTGRCVSELRVQRKKD
ncbi:MAG: hypothetical protein AB1898_25910 [Acidobacteriota bacterium]